jgi:hypothetical protein
MSEKEIKRLISGDYLNDLGELDEESEQEEIACNCIDPEFCSSRLTGQCDHLFEDDDDSYGAPRFDEEITGTFDFTHLKFRGDLSDD